MTHGGRAAILLLGGVGRLVITVGVAAAEHLRSADARQPSVLGGRSAREGEEVWTVGMVEETLTLVPLADNCFMGLFADKKCSSGGVYHLSPEWVRKHPLTHHGTLEAHCGRVHFDWASFATAHFP